MVETKFDVSQRNVQSAAKSVRKLSTARNLTKANVERTENKENKTKCTIIKNRLTHQKEVCFLDGPPLPETMLAI